MPIITKPSEALALALKVMQSPECPWSAFNPNRGSHRYTCNCLDYLEAAEEITKEAMEKALDALYPFSPLFETLQNERPPSYAPWFASQGMREAAIQKAIETLKAEGN